MAQPINKIDSNAEIKGDIPNAEIHGNSRSELRQLAQSCRHRQCKAVPSLVGRCQEGFVEQCHGRVLVAEPAFHPRRKREIAHAVGEKKDSPALAAELRHYRLEGVKKACDMKGGAARLALVPQIVVGQKMRRRRDKLAERRPTEGDDRGVRGGYAGGGEPFAIERRAGDRVEKGIRKTVNEDEQVLPRADNVLNYPGLEPARLGV